MLRTKDLNRSLDTLAVQLSSSLAQGLIQMSARVSSVAWNWRLLTALSESPTNVAALSSRLQVSHPHVSRCLSKLEASGHVISVSDDSDGRKRFVKLTPKGEHDRLQLLHAQEEALSLVVADWQLNDINDLTRLVKKLSRDLQVHKDSYAVFSVPGVNY